MIYPHICQHLKQRETHPPVCDGCGLTLIPEANYLPPELASKLLEEDAPVPAIPLADPILREFLDCLGEEAAEVIQVASKIKRFGFRINPYNQVHNRDHLESEIGDLLAQVEVLALLGHVDQGRIAGHRRVKAAALRVNTGRIAEASRQVLLAADARRLELDHADDYPSDEYGK